MISLFKAKCKVLHMGQGNLKHRHRLGAELIDRSPDEKDLRVLMEEKLNITQQCALAAQQANCILGCVKSSMDSSSRELIRPLCSTLVRPTWSPASSSGALTTGKTWTCWSGSRGGPQK